MRLRLDLDNETTDELMALALRELRPAPLQAEVLLRRALGLPVPKEGPAITICAVKDKELVVAGEEHA